jgi:hypothetical protein
LPSQAPPAAVRTRVGLVLAATAGAAILVALMVALAGGDDPVAHEETGTDGAVAARPADDSVQTDATSAPSATPSASVDELHQPPHATSAGSLSAEPADTSTPRRRRRRVAPKPSGTGSDPFDALGGRH